MFPDAGGADADAAVTERSGTATAPTAESTDTAAPVTTDGGEVTAAAAANDTAPALQTVPVNGTLGSYDAPVALHVIPVAIAVLPSGKVWILIEPL